MRGEAKVYNTHSSLWVSALNLLYQWRPEGGGLLIFVAFQRKGWDSDIKVGAIRPLKSKSTPAK